MRADKGAPTSNNIKILPRYFAGLPLTGRMLKFRRLKTTEASLDSREFETQLKAEGFQEIELQEPTRQ
jgi:hypothetical protein